MGHETGDENESLDERPEDLASHVSRLTTSRSLRFALKAWPVIAAATIGLCFLTQTVAGWFGIELKEQANVETVRTMFRHAFDSWKLFGVASLNVVLILAACPIFEELIFRWFLFRWPIRWWNRTHGTMGRHETPTPVQGILLATVSSALFSAAHYLQQPWPDNAFFALFFFGLAQCWLYKKTDRLWCPILNHALFNLTNLVLLFVIPQS